MPGAGAGEISWAPESSYNGGVGGTPTYYGFGANTQVQTAELNRNLLRIVAPGNVEAQEFLATRLEGQLDVSFVLETDEFHRLVFNDAFTGFTSGLVNSAEVYLGVNYIGGTTERQITGWAPATCSVEYQGSTETVRVTLSGPYASEEKNTSITNGSSATTSGSEVPGHGASLSIAGSGVGDRLQSATLQFEQISRLITGASQTAIDAVAGDVQQSIEMSKVYNGPDLYERALGSAGSSTIQDQVDEVSGTLTFSAGGGTVADYSFTKVAPETYNWVDLINNEADLNEEINFRATGVTASDPTA
jgi:hypothetical protein